MIVTVDIKADINAYDVCDEVVTWLSDLYKCEVTATACVWASSDGRKQDVQEAGTQGS